MIFHITEQSRNPAMSSVPPLRLSRSANFGPLEVGCDTRANANAGTPIRESGEPHYKYRQ